jgi:hypothetical protein
MRDLGDVEVVLAAFERDASAAYSQSLQDSAALARELGDFAGGSIAAQEAARASVNAKMSAFAAARASDVPYQEPAGVLPGVPTGAAGGKLPGSPA